MWTKTILKIFPNFTRNYSQNTSKVLVSERLKGPHSGIAVFGLNRPEQKNAMSMHLLDSLIKAVDQIPFENNIKVLVIRSLVPGVFCAGIYFSQNSY